MPPVRRSRFPGLEGAGERRRELIEELVRVRRESDLSQTEIAARMGTSQSAVARLESGELDARLLAPATRPQILTRSLTNLKRLYVRMRSFPQARLITDLLLAVEQHPAMLLYLDNHLSVGPNSRAAKILSRRRTDRQVGINENLAREILELHTLGVNGGYTQKDVTTFAEVITGWSIGGEGRLKKGERVVAHPVLRVVDRDPGGLRDEALAPGRIGGEEVADLHVRDLLVVALQRGPGLGGGRHRAERTSATA